jgi:hypothetical protein
MATKRWKDIRSGLVERLGGGAVVAEAHLRNQTYIDAQRLVKRCPRRADHAGVARDHRNVADRARRGLEDRSPLASLRGWRRSVRKAMGMLP